MVPPNETIVFNTWSNVSYLQLSSLHFMFRRLHRGWICCRRDYRLARLIVPCLVNSPIDKHFSRPTIEIPELIMPSDLVAKGPEAE